MNLAEMTTQEPQPVPGSSVLGRLLKIADGYRSDNRPRQAIELYFELVETQPASPEAAAARERLLGIGEQYERAGELRQARSLYERLL